MILRDGNERLILNMRNDTSSYSNEPHQESINMIDIYNVSHEEIREDLFATNHQSGNPTSSLTSHTDLTSSEVINQLSGNPTPISELETKSSSSSPTLISLEESELIWEEFEAYLASDSFPLGNSNPSSLLPPFHNSLSGSTTSSSPSLHISETSDYFLEEFADELAHITFPPGNDDLPFDAESDLLELEYLLNHDPIKDMDSILEDSVDENSLDDTISEMFTDEHALDYSSPPLWGGGYDSVFYEDFPRLRLCLQPTTRTRIFNLPLPLYELPFHKEVPGLEILLLFSSKNEEKVFNPGILTSKRVHTSLLPPETISSEALKLSKDIKFLP
ncbi:hypothetical protein Tco_0490730 [Tanacetum coccineum]